MKWSDGHDRSWNYKHGPMIKSSISDVHYYLCSISVSHKFPSLSILLRSSTCCQWTFTAHFRPTVYAHAPYYADLHINQNGQFHNRSQSKAPSNQFHRTAYNVESCETASMLEWLCAKDKNNRCRWIGLLFDLLLQYACNEMQSVYARIISVSKGAEN